ncbi:MAG: phosphotransferase [Nitrospinae bacterium]|nr:phosphotransferase [Nitrospinota bacterium]
MIVEPGINEQFKLLVIEVIRQIENTMAAIEGGDARIGERIREREDYIDNLKSVIENKCFSVMVGGQPPDKRTADSVRATLTIASNLERIADFMINILDQMSHFSAQDFIKRYDYESFFDELGSAIEGVEAAMAGRDISLALKICRSEMSLDKLYKISFERILKELGSGRNVGDLITTLFILRYLERAGDSLLNIGEAVIFSILGDKFKIHEYRVLEETLASSDISGAIADVEVESIWGTRSGCRISKVHRKEGPGKDKEVIFKHGRLRKLAMERENIARWKEIEPGLTPEIVGFQNGSAEGALLLEYLGGHSFEEIATKGDGEEEKEAYDALKELLSRVWAKTMKPSKASAGYVRQLSERLTETRRLHPYFGSTAKQIGAVRVMSLNEIIRRAEDLDAALSAPFSVFIHGDFNVNNILYDHREKRIHFIDLYRSKESDYLQDVSVFMVSHFRLPTPDFERRQLINERVLDFYRFATEYAGQMGDASFNARLTLGLARSFITSTRFVAKKDFAKIMYMRGVYFLEKLLGHEGKPWEEFEIPLEAVVF